MEDDAHGRPPAVHNDLSGQVVGNVAQIGYVNQFVHNAPAPAPVAIPRQLPPTPSGFVNRVADLVRFDSLLEENTPLTVVVSGLGGVGKSATSRRWAHQVSDRFADGQLYADLQGAGVSDVLGGFLRALGVHEQWIPASLSERTALYRSRTADLKLLVLLDDVEHVAQVVPLLPASTASAVVVTSHRQLSALVVEGATSIPLAPLETSEGVRLLTAMIGQERAEREPEAVAELARLCGGLPIALRVAGARLMQRQAWPVRKLVAELSDKRRLTLVGAVFEAAYEALPLAARRLYRVMGLLPVTGFCPELAAATGDADAEDALEALLEANLIEEIGVERYRFHDLVKLHASAGAEQETDREAVLHRAVSWYAGMIATADHLIMGQRVRLAPPPGPLEHQSLFTTPGEALDWLDAERGNVLALLRVASAAGWDEPVWQSAEALWALYHHRKHYADWLEASRLGALSAQRLGDRAAEARMRNQLVRAHLELGEVAAAETELARAEEVADDPRMRAVVVESWGKIDLAHGRFDAAAERFDQALRIHEEIGNPRGVGLQTYQVGVARNSAGRHEEAAARLERALAIAESVGDELTQGKIFIELGSAYRQLGRRAEATTLLEKGIAIMRASRIPGKELIAWKVLIELDASRERLEQAIALCAALGDQQQADALRARLS